MKNAIIFAVGCAVGSVMTWYLVKDRYERMANEEIESVKAVFSKRKQEEKAEKEQTEQKKATDDHSAYENIIEKAGYAKKYGDAYAKDKEAEKVKEDMPYVISPEEFGELDDYETISLRYYEEDGVLADDETGDIVEDLDDVVGSDSLDHFGEYEDDSVFVRNDRLKSDYEILLDVGAYSENRRYDV